MLGRPYKVEARFSSSWDGGREMKGVVAASSQLSQSLGSWLVWEGSSSCCSWAPLYRAIPEPQTPGDGLGPLTVRATSSCQVCLLLSSLGLNQKVFLSKFYLASKEVREDDKQNKTKLNYDGIVSSGSDLQGDRVRPKSRFSGPRG